MIRCLRLRVKRISRLTKVEVKVEVEAEEKVESR